jgi:alpha-beta hydrolase superfamily lysophospholipase
MIARIVGRPLVRVLSWVWAVLDLLNAPTGVVRERVRGPLAGLDPSDVSLEWAEVPLESELGVNPAWWVPAHRSDAPGAALTQRWVIFIHGRGGDRVVSLDMLPFMHRWGFNSLVITQRNDAGAPMSPDQRDHLGATEWRDLEAAVAFADQQGAQDIVLFARSAGGAVVGQFLSRSPYAPLIWRVVLDNPVLDWRVVFHNAKPWWVPGALADLIIWGNMRKIRARISQFNLVKNPPLYRPPTLILHAKRDEVCPVEVSRRLVEERPDTWNVVLVETEGGHEGGRFAEPENYLTMVQAWLYSDRWDKTLMAETPDVMPRVSA